MNEFIVKIKTVNGTAVKKDKKSDGDLSITQELNRVSSESQSAQL